MMLSKGKLVAVCMIWIFVVGLAAVTWRWVVLPRQQQQQAEAERDAEQQRRRETSSPSAYDFKIRLGLDSFSGYAVLRSSEFRQRLTAARLDLELVDDQANYGQRLQMLHDGEIQIAAFPIDALIIQSAKLGKLPAVIIGVIDETRGADAIVAYRDAIPNPESLDDPDVRFVLTPGSPSEMLVRLLQSQFRWGKLADNAIVPARDAEDVLHRFRQSKPSSKEVFVTWEPYVSQILEYDAMVRVVDSSRFKGYIVDCLVANRDFLIKNPSLAENVMAAYLRALYHYRDDMRTLVLQDAQDLGQSLSEEQASHLVEGIWWKNTLENFEHFGLASQRLQLLEDILENITRVLLQTKAIDADPTHGKPNEWFYRKPLEALQGSKFHPNLGSETVRNDQIDLPPLSDLQWTQLIAVGELQVDELVFPRGQATLTERSLAILDDLAARLKTYPQYYLLIRGNASQAGKLELNQALALRRAEAAMAHLVQAGIPAKRVKAVAGKPSGNMSVTFVLGQPAY